MPAKKIFNSLMTTRFNFRVTPEQKEKILALGGTEFVRAVVLRAIAAKERK